MIFKEETIGNISNRIFSGGTPDTRKNDYWNGNLNWLSSGETRNKYIYKTEKNITQLGADNSSTRLAHKGDIVIASAGQGYTRGQTSMLMNDMYINQSLICIECDKSKVNNYYLFYLLSSQYDKLRFVSNENSSRGSLTTKIINEYSVKLPTLENQTKIVNILKALDGKIELNNEINNNLHELIRSMYDELVSNADWDEVELSQVASVSSGKRPTTKNETGEYPIIGANGIMAYTNEFNMNSDLIITGRVGTLGVVKRYYKPIWASDNTLIVNTKYLNYIESYLKTIDYNSLNRGSTQPLLTQGDLNKQTLLFSENEVLEFESKVTPIVNKIRFNEEQNEILRQLRDTLLPKLMNGEIALDNIEI